jgi:hypothetical protein
LSPFSFCFFGGLGKISPVEKSNAVTVLTDAGNHIKEGRVQKISFRHFNFKWILLVKGETNISFCDTSYFLFAIHQKGIHTSML